MKKGKFILPITVFALLISFGLASCNNGGNEANKSGQSAQQQKIKVTAEGSKTKLLKGETVQLTADVDGVTWESSKPEIASVSGAGLVTALTKGSASISASKDGYRAGSISITVDYPNITITAEGNKTTLMYGETVKLSSDKDGVAWSSSNEAVATVDATGLVTSVSKGSATIKAAKADHNDGTIEITVNYPDITVTAAENKTDLLVDETVQLSADKDGVTWESENAAIAEVSATGLVTAKKYGSVKILAKKDHHNDGEITINVVRPAPSAVLHMEDADHYAADGAWTSSNSSSNIDPTTPVYGKSNASDGTCLAHFGAGDIETISFTSDKAVKAEIVLMIGYYYSVTDLRDIYDVRFNSAPVTFEAQGYVSEDTTNYTYKPLSFGELDIIEGTNVLEITMKENADNRFPYMDDLNIYASEAITIQVVKAPEVTVSESNFALTVGETAQINTETEGVTYTSSNEDVAEVSTSGLITAKAKGSATITVSKDGMKSAKVLVSVGESLTFDGTQLKVEAEDCMLDSGIVIRNASGGETLTSTWAANNALTLRFNSSVAGTFALSFVGRAGGQYGTSNIDDLSTVIEVKFNNADVEVSGAVSGRTFEEYALGDIEVVASANILVIKGLQADKAPNIDYILISPKAAA